MASYSSSERRGIIALALLALLIVVGAMCLSFCHRQSANSEPYVEIHKEFIDSAASREKSSIYRSSSKKKAGNKSKSGKEKKTYRRRSPLDEPV